MRPNSKSRKKTKSKPKKNRFGKEKQPKDLNNINEKNKPPNSDLQITPSIINVSLKDHFLYCDKGAGFVKLDTLLAFEFGAAAISVTYRQKDFPKEEYVQTLFNVINKIQRDLYQEFEKHKYLLKRSSKDHLLGKEVKSYPQIMAALILQQLITIKEEKEQLMIKREKLPVKNVKEISDLAEMIFLLEIRQSIFEKINEQLEKYIGYKDQADNIYFKGKKWEFSEIGAMGIILSFGDLVSTIKIKFITEPNIVSNSSDRSKYAPFTLSFYRLSEREKEEFKRALTQEEFLAHFIGQEKLEKIPEEVLSNISISHYKKWYSKFLYLFSREIMIEDYLVQPIIANNIMNEFMEKIIQNLTEARRLYNTYKSDKNQNIRQEMINFLEIIDKELENAIKTLKSKEHLMRPSQIQMEILGKESELIQKLKNICKSYRKDEPFFADNGFRASLEKINFVLNYRENRYILIFSYPQSKRLSNNNNTQDNVKLFRHNLEYNQTIIKEEQKWPKWLKEILVLRNSSLLLIKVVNVQVYNYLTDDSNSLLLFYEELIKFSNVNITNNKLDRENLKNNLNDIVELIKLKRTKLTFKVSNQELSAQEAIIEYLKYECKQLLKIIHSDKNHSKTATEDTQYINSMMENIIEIEIKIKEQNMLYSQALGRLNQQQNQNNNSHTSLGKNSNGMGQFI